jgi:hypothetical protein
MPRIKKCKPVKHTKKLLLAVSLWFIAGYVIHNSLNMVVESRLTNRFMDCLTDTQGNFTVCTVLVQPESWEKIVRF